MSPEEKEQINKVLKKMGGKYTVDELEVIRKRSIRTLQEWSSQDALTRDALPQEVKDLKMIGNYVVLMTLSGLLPPISCMGIIEMNIEAAYNLGKAAPKT